MASSLIDVCRFTPTAGGTTDWTYSSAVGGYQSPAAAAVVNGATYSYRAESNDLTQWEVGTGTYNTSTGVLTRGTVLYNSSGTGTTTGQSGAGSKINFSTTPQVAIVALAEDIATQTQVRQRLFPGAAPGANTVTWYVDGTNGNDANAGTSAGAGAKKTIQAMVDWVSQNIDANQQNIVIQVNDASASTAGVILKSVVGIYDFWPNSTLLLSGNVSSLVPLNTGSNICVTAVNVTGWRVEGFAFNSSTAWIEADAGSHIYVGTNSGTGNPAFGFEAVYTGFMEFVSGTTFTSLCTAQQSLVYTVFGGTVIFAGSNTITLNNSIAYTYFFNADAGSRIIAAANTYSGAGASGSTGTTFSVTNGSYINTGGHASGKGGGSNLPGSVVGTATTGWVV